MHIAPLSILQASLTGFRRRILECQIHIQLKTLVFIAMEIDWRNGSMVLTGETGDVYYK